MRKAILLLGSFAAGVLSTLLALSQTSTIVHSSSAFAGLVGVGSEYVPTVRGLGVQMISNTLAGGTQQLDGLNCLQCTFSHVTFTYGGGAYKIPAFTADNVDFVFTGAAANTIRALILAKLLTSLPPAPPSQPKGSIKLTAPANMPHTISFVSLSGAP